MLSRAFVVDFSGQYRDAYASPGTGLSWQGLRFYRGDPGPTAVRKESFSLFTRHLSFGAALSASAPCRATISRPA